MVHGFPAFMHYIKKHHACSNAGWFNLSFRLSCMQSEYSYSCVAKAMAYWLIIASVIAIAAACPYSQSYESNLPGTDCSVFNYTKQCCLPHSSCKAVSNMSWSCGCSPECYTDSRVKCCKDIHCPTSNDILIQL